MSSIKTESHIDFRQNQAQNLVLHNLASAPSAPKEGQTYYNTATKKFYCWNGSRWIEGTTIATDAQATTGTDTTVAINPKQLKDGLDSKQDKLTFTPENVANKTTTLSSNSTLDQYPAAKTVYTELELKATKASPTFTGTPKAPTATAGDSSTQIANTEFVQNAVNTAVTGALVYKSLWDTTNATDYSALNSYRPLKKGNYFRVTGSGCTIDGVEYRAGDMIVCNRDIATSTTIITAALDHYDHTEREDIVFLDEVQTLTNKTINAENNTISGLTVENFALNTILTTTTNVPVTDDNLMSSAKITSKLNEKAPLASPSFTGTPTAPTASESTNNTQLATTAFVQNAVSKATAGALKKQTFKNTLLAPVDGVCTWTISHTLGTTDIICNITEVSSGNKVLMTEQATSETTFTIKFNAAASVSANTYKAVLIGV